MKSDFLPYPYHLVKTNNFNNNDIYLAIMKSWARFDLDLIPWRNSSQKQDKLLKNTFEHNAFFVPGHVL